MGLKNAKENELKGGLSVDEGMIADLVPYSKDFVLEQSHCHQLMPGHIFQYLRP